MVNITIKQEYNAVTSQLEKMGYVCDCNSSRKEINLNNLVYQCRELKKLGISSIILNL